MNAWAVSVVRYSAGVLDWTDKELKAMDVRTRKLSTMFGAFHRNSGGQTVHEKEGGLISVRECVKAEEIALREYVVASEEWMLKAVGETVVIGETLVGYRERVVRERKESLAEKKVLGKFRKDVKDVVDGRSWQWLRGGYLSKSKEAFVVAAQEQVLRTRFRRATIENEAVDPSCRVCGKQVESVGHLASGCSGLAGREYRRRHDRLGVLRAA